MDRKASTTSHPTSGKTETAAIPRVPQEIIDEILGHIAADPTFSAVISLRSCSLVSKSWVPTCQRHLFHTVTFTSKNIGKWLNAFPVPEESPAHYVRYLSAQIGERDCIPEEFFQRTLPWFGNVKNVALWGDWYGRQVYPFWRLPQPVTTLAIGMNAFTLMEIRDLLARLPNLDNLSHSCCLADDRARPVIEAVPRGRFSGRLQLLGGPAHEDLANMLLEVPTGLRFTEMDISCRRKCLLSSVRLVEACAKTLVKLSFGISFHGKPHSSSLADSSARTDAVSQCR